MATTVTLTMGDLIEEVLATIQRAQERPRQAVVNGAALIGATTITVDDASAITAPVVLEIGTELMLCTAVATNDLTVSRGYADTTAAAVDDNAVVKINPLFPRREVQRRIEQFFSGPANNYLPKMESAVMNTTSGEYFIDMPADCIEVLSVRYTGTSGKIVYIGNWELQQDLPTATWATGKALVVSGSTAPTDNMIVTYTVPHEWSDATVVDTSTIEITLGTKDLPALYAAARLISGREYTRLELDYVEEWGQAEAIRAGLPVRYIQQLWQEYYRRLDEARRIQYRHKHRPFRKMTRGAV